uniref:Uncharacterized protein n=2 Tax=Spongospora subterranea TaxID=70186 RepID=A0A0H5RRR4_9EUKA|eukprot:CRZ11409.1 hypothetical protein [Spongospora subterranea]
MMVTGSSNCGLIVRKSLNGIDGPDKSPYLDLAPSRLLQQVKQQAKSDWDAMRDHDAMRYNDSDNNDEHIWSVDDNNDLLRQVQQGLLTIMQDNGSRPYAIIDDLVHAAIAPRSQYHIRKILPAPAAIGGSSVRFYAHCEGGSIQILISSSNKVNVLSSDWPTTVENSMWKSVLSSSEQPNISIRPDLSSSRRSQYLQITIVNQSDLHSLVTLKCLLCDTCDVEIKQREHSSIAGTVKENLIKRINDIKRDPHLWHQFVHRIQNVRQKRLKSNRRLKRITKNGKRNYNGNQCDKDRSYEWMSILTSARSICILSELIPRRNRLSDQSHDPHLPDLKDEHEQTVRVVDDIALFDAGQGMLSIPQNAFLNSTPLLEPATSVVMYLDHANVDQHQPDQPVPSNELSKVLPRYVKVMNTFSAVPVIDYICQRYGLGDIGRSPKSNHNAIDKRLKVINSIRISAANSRSTNLVEADRLYRARRCRLQRLQHRIFLMVNGQQEFARLKSRPWSPPLLLSSRYMAS